MNAPNYTATVVPCGACGQFLTVAEVLELWSDRDWCHHQGHRIYIREHDLRTYFGVARDLSNGRDEG